jgi:dihydroorotate dehydrogenase electron transfer subunit
MVANKRPGDRVWLRGPFGNGFRPQPHHNRIALIGGGYGVAPLSWLAEMQAGTSAEVTTILGARTAADLLLAGRFSRMDGKGSAMRTILTTEDGTNPAEMTARKGRVTDALAPLLDAGTLDAIFACGPDGMLAAIESLARRHRVPAQLSWEAYMRCAVGICGACEHNGKLLCLDGPVLEG